MEAGYYCNARLPNKPGAYCRHRAGAGTDHIGAGRCKRHGGATPVLRDKAKREMAMREVRFFGLPRDIDPHEALLHTVRSAYAMTVWLQAKIQSMDSDRELTQTVWGEEGPSKVERSVWVELYQDALKDLNKFAKIAVDAGVEERRVQMAERQGQKMTEFMDRVFEQLDVPPRRRAEIVRAAIEELPEHAEVLSVDAGQG